MDITQELINQVTANVVAQLQVKQPTPESPAAIRAKVGLITREEFAAAAGRTVRSLKRDAVRRVGPKPVRMGQQVFYRVADIERYIEEQVAR
jgi:hypothetical protein